MDTINIIWTVALALDIIIIGSCFGDFFVVDIEATVIIAVALGMINITAMVVHYGYYSEAIDIPNKYHALLKNVEEINPNDTWHKKLLKNLKYTTKNYRQELPLGLYAWSMTPGLKAEVKKFPWGKKKYQYKKIGNIHIPIDVW